MLEINVYSDIANKKESVYLSMLGMENTVFSADKVKEIFQNNKNEKEFKFNIHCDGGSVAEGLAIYDILRNSGKTIHTNIEGSCHSMAITLLLAAPKQNRTANTNCRALIHEVRAASYDYMTAEECRQLAEEIETEQNTILDIYADRTGTDRNILQNLMKEEKQRTAKELLQYGFIDKINNYTTNKLANKTNGKMSKQNKEILNMADRLLARLKNTLNTGAVNYDFTDEEGNVLFSTQEENDTLEVGMAASPDGTFELPNGTTVTIAEGEITAIDSPEENEEVENLRSRVAKLENLLAESQKVITNLKNSAGSTYNVRGRINNPGKNKRGVEKTPAEKRTEAKEKMNQFKGGK